MECPSCCAVTPDDRKFCMNCGVELPMSCPSCGGASPPKSKFCAECGARLEAGIASSTAAKSALVAPRAATAEAGRRQLTVMFCDLVGSTALSAELDPEDLRALIREYQDVCAGAVARFEGFLAQFMGDGVLAYFGYPRAHENDAERAVHAGLHIIQGMRQLNSPKSDPLQVRIGIATGLVVVGDLIGTRTHEQVATGETPNLAARLQNAAAPDSVVISASTRRLLGGIFELADLGSHLLKGIPQPVQVWRVIGESPTESRFEATHSANLSGLVGRKQELALLCERWEQAEAGNGQVVLVSGEAGIGKSRICQALGERIADRPHTRIHYQCSPYHTNSALYPAVRHLERTGGFAPEDSPGSKLDKLEALLARSGQQATEAMALIATLLSIPTGERYPPLNLSPQQQKQWTLQALADQIVGLARAQPVLFILEDAHWIDPTSQELAELCIDRVKNVPVLMAITYRPSFASPWPSYDHVTALALNRLGRRQCASLAERVAARKILPPSVLDQIVAKADGMPLFIEELTKSVLESGLLRDENARYPLTGPLPPLAIPATLQDSLMARLDRLSSANEVAQIAAVIGHEFSYALLAGVAERGDKELQAALAQLTEAELIFCRGTPPQSSYSFKHTLVQDAAYDSLLRGRRQQLHSKIAAVLAECFPEVARTQPELLAHHYAAAGLAAQAASHWLNAGRRAVERSANVEAIHQLNKSLKMLEQLSDTPDRARLELDLQTTLGPALLATKGWAASEPAQAYMRARELCQRLGDDRELFKALWGLWFFHDKRGEASAAREDVNQLLRVAERQDDTALRLQAHHAAWASATFFGELASAREHVNRGLGLYNPEEHRSHAVLYGGHDPGVCGRGLGALSLWLLGYPEQAVRSVRQALSLAEHLLHAPSLAHAMLWQALCHQFRGEPEPVLSCGESLVAIAAEQGLALYAAAGTMMRGWALSHQGQTGKGIAEMRRGLDAYAATGTKLMAAYFKTMLAETCLRAGETEVGLTVLEEALSLTDQTGERFWEAGALHLKGELLLSASAPRQAEVEECYQRALAVARGQRAKSLELRVSTSLARLWQGQDKPAQAHALLAPGYAWFTEGFDTPDLLDAKQVLDQLRQSTPVYASGAG